MSGSTTIGAIVTASSLDTFCFEFNGAITIDSILWNNQPISFVRNAAITYALLPTAQLQNTDLRIQIFYDGDASVTGAEAIRQQIQHRYFTNMGQLSHLEFERTFQRLRMVPLQTNVTR